MLPIIMLVFILCLMGLFILFAFLQKNTSSSVENTILTEKELNDLQKKIKELK